MRQLICIEHVDCEGLGMFAAVPAEEGIAVEEVRCYDGDRVPPRLPPDTGLVILGGPMNVDQTDEYPHLAEVMRLVRWAADHEAPILGVCLGGQLVARALGAPVRAGVAEEIGWSCIDLTESAADDPLFRGFDAALPVFQWHRDMFELPEGAVLLATSPACRNQAFRFGGNTYGIQFHIEVTEAQARSWVSRYLQDFDTLDADRQARFIGRFAEHRRALQQRSDALFRRFLGRR